MRLLAGDFAETRGDHGDLHRFLHRVVLHRAENDVGILMRGLLNDRRSFVNFVQRRLDEPVTLIRMPCAPLMQLSSSSGLLMARLAASMARFVPEATAVPITA